MRAIRRTAALTVLAGAAAAAGLVALGHGGSGTLAAPRAPLVERAGFDPPAAGFGDRIEATIAIELDRRLTFAQTLRVRYDLAPLRPIGATRTVRLVSGDAELVTIAVPVACVSDACITSTGVAQLRLAPARASVVTATGARTVAAAWPTLAVRDRVRAADVNASPPQLQADASPMAPTYRVAPAALAAALDVAAALLGLGAVGLAAWELALLARRRRSGPEAPLERAIRIARTSHGLAGPERRRALEVLARALGRGELAHEATRLAWSPPTPEPAEVEELVQAVERERPR